MKNGHIISKDTNIYKELHRYWRKIWIEVSKDVANGGFLGADRVKVHEKFSNSTGTKWVHNGNWVLEDLLIINVDKLLQWRMKGE